MSGARSRSEELLTEWRDAVVPVEESERAKARRDHVVPRLRRIADEAYGARVRRERFLRWGAASAAAAAIVLYGAYRLLPFGAKGIASPANEILALAGSVEIIHPTGAVAAPAQHAVAIDAADEVVTSEGASARASLASGAELEIGPESRVRLLTASQAAGPAPGETVDLAAGRVRVHVPKLGQARSFAVRTPDTTVIVHGTVFSVERRAGGADGKPLTNVQVDEGRVAVRHGGTEVFLQAGDRWSSSGETSGVPPEPGSSAELRTPPDGINSRATPRARERRSSLARENQLLDAAMNARQQGDPARALQLTDQLLRRFPRSPLAEDARVERMRSLLAARGPAAAAREARLYLADYPQGFARDEASRLASAAQP